MRTIGCILDCMSIKCQCCELYEEAHLIRPYIVDYSPPDIIQGSFVLSGYSSQRVNNALAEGATQDQDIKNTGTQGGYLYNIYKRECLRLLEAVKRTIHDIINCTYINPLEALLARQGTTFLPPIFEQQLRYIVYLFQYSADEIRTTEGVQDYEAHQEYLPVVFNPRDAYFGRTDAEQHLIRHIGKMQRHRSSSADIIHRRTSLPPLG